MSRTFSDLERVALNGETMGTRWSAVVHAPAGLDRVPVQLAMQAAVEAVDAEMSLWRQDSALCRINRAAPEAWIEVPQAVIEVLTAALLMNRDSDGAFEIGMGDAVDAWGFGPGAADPEAIRTALHRSRQPSWQVLEVDLANRRVRKHASMQLDLNGIAKGYGVDRLAAVARDAGIVNALLSIDGELVALGTQPGGSAWPVAVEAPDYGVRRPHSVLTLEDAAVATSGDYRHWVEVAGRRLSHTMDPARGGPLPDGPASVSVVARDCMTADALATAVMVLGPDRGAGLCERHGASALVLTRQGTDVQAQGIGPIFAREAA